MNARGRSALFLAILLPFAGLSSLVALWRQGAPPAPAAPAPVLQWRRGHGQHYSFRVDSTVFVSADDRVDRTQPIEQQLRGVIELQTLDVGPDAATVGVRLDPVELRMSGVTDADTNRRLGAPFRVRFLASGLPVEFFFPDAVAPEHCELLEELLRTFQLVVRGEPAWTAEETHRTGTYTARYERDGAARVRRTKLSYAPPDDAGVSAPQVQVLASQATVQLDPDVDWISGMDLQETLAASDPSGPGFEVVTRAKLELLAPSARPIALPSSTWSFPARDPAVAAEAAAPAVSPLAAVPTEQLEQQLDELLAALDASPKGRIDWIHRLRDLLQADRRVAALLLGIMQRRSMSDRTRADLFLAFELGSTVEAQASLCRVVTEPGWTHRDRTRALIALGGSEHPTDASLSALWAAVQNRATSEAQDQANTAMLALGALARRLVGVDGARYANLRDGLLSAAWGTGDPGARAIVVTALGNTGDAALGAEVVPFLDDAAPVVRRAAAKTFGKLSPEDAAIELGLRLEHEKSSAVRAAMAAAMAKCGSPPPEVMEVARAAIGDERDEVARLELARFLGRNLAANPENERALRSLLESERSTKVRRYLGEVLGKAGSVAGQAAGGDASRDR